MKKLFTRVAILISVCCAFSFNAVATTHTVGVGVAGNNFSPATMTFCLGDTVFFVWSSGFHSVDFTSPDEPVSGNLTAVGDTFKYVPLTAGVYNYECGVHGPMMSGMFTVNDVPVVNLGPDTIQCAGTVILDAGNAGSTYLWSDASTTQTITVSASGTYSVVVTNGCGNSSDTINVTINPGVIINLGPDTVTCVASIMLDAQNAGPNYMWSTGATAQTITVTTSGTYYVNVTDGN